MERGSPVGTVALRVGTRFNLLRGFWLVQDDATLARLTLKGDLRAQEALIERHYAAVYRVAYGVLCEHNSALDVAQGVFARLRRLLRHYDGRSALKSYLYRAGVNAAIDELRRRRRRGETAQVEPMQEQAPRGAQRDLEAAQVVRRALEELPARQRAALALRDIEGLSTGETAAVLGITPSGVRTLIAEGRLRLKRVIETRFPEYADWSK